MLEFLFDHHRGVTLGRVELVPNIETDLGVAGERAEKANGCGRARDKGVDRLVARAALIWGACRHQTDQVELRVIDDESDLGNPRRIAREEVCDDRSEAPGALKV